MLFGKVTSHFFIGPNIIDNIFLTMPILFSAVAFKKNVMYKLALCDGNFEEIIEGVMKKISCDDNKMTYYHGSYLLHFIMENEYFYFCITDKLCQRSRAFLFLNEIKRSFQTNKDSFTHTLAKQMHCYNEDGGTITIRKGDIDEINSIGVESCESLLGEKLLIVNNNNLKYSIISDVVATPETVEISYKKSYFNIYVIASLVIAIALFLCHPASFVIIILFAILYAIVR